MERIQTNRAKSIEVTDAEEVKANNTELVERHQVKDTPFTIIGTDEKYFGTMGKFRLTESYTTREEAEAELTKITWNRLIQVTMLLIDHMDNYKSIINNSKNNNE